MMFLLLVLSSGPIAPSHDAPFVTISQKYSCYKHVILDCFFCHDDILSHVFFVMFLN